MIANFAQPIGIIDLGSNTAWPVKLNAVPGYAYRLAAILRLAEFLERGRTAR